MNSSVVPAAFYPRVAVFTNKEVDDFVKNIQHDSLLSLLEFAPKPETITVRNTRQMSAKLNDIEPKFVSVPAIAKFPGIDDADVLLRNILDSTEGSSVFYPWLAGVLDQTTSAVASFETWSHPVAGIIAITASTPDPLDALQRLYDESFQHFASLPFINAEFLRYFVIVHDEGGNWDETVSLFEHVKQKFGPHSAILRLGSSQDQQNTENASTLIRDLISQSVIPFMEECCSVWFEQVNASKQGFAGRLLSVGRRYLTNSSKLSINVLETVARKSQRYISSPHANAPLKSNFHTDAGGYYHWSAPQAQLRKIADFAMILRDYKFANSIYEMLRKEYTSDKAWSCAASAQEMACCTNLLMSATPLTKDSIIDTLMDSSVYTYISRCHLPLYALRCILVVTNLLTELPTDPNIPATTQVSTTCAVKWLTQALDQQLATPLSFPLVCEQISIAYRSFDQQRGKNVGGRKRKASFWLLVASQHWLKTEYTTQSSRCFSECKSTYTPLQLSQDILFRNLTEKLGA